MMITESDLRKIIRQSILKESELLVGMMVAAAARKRRQAAAKKRASGTGRGYGRRMSDAEYTAMIDRQNARRTAEEEAQRDAERAAEESRVFGIRNSRSRKMQLKNARAGHLLFLVDVSHPELQLFKYPGDNRVFKQPQFRGLQGEPREVWLDHTLNEIGGILATGFQVSQENMRKLKIVGDNQGIDLDISEFLSQRGVQQDVGMGINVSQARGIDGTYFVSVSHDELQTILREIKSLLNEIIQGRNGKKYQISRGLSNYLRECARRIRAGQRLL